MPADIYKSYLQQQIAQYQTRSDAIVNQITELNNQQSELDTAIADAQNIIDFIDGGAEMPQLIAPSGFALTPGNTQVDIEWDNDPYADNYIIQRSVNSDFTGAATVYDDVWTATVTDVSLINDTVYYYRIKSQGAGFTDSAFVSDDATPHA